MSEIGQIVKLKNNCLSLELEEIRSIKVGDKLICIDDSPIIPAYGKSVKVSLTKYKCYDVVEIYSNFLWMIVNDDGEKSSYNHDRFVSLLEYRKQKLEKICLKLVI